MSGILDVLSVGRGHLRVTIDGSDPADVEKARRMITDMLARGFSIFVETDKGLSRVKRFNPKRMTYLIDDVPEEAATARETRKGKTPKREVAVGKSKATVVGRSAGG